MRRLQRQQHRRRNELVKNAATTKARQTHDGLDRPDDERDGQQADDAVQQM